ASTIWTQENPTKIGSVVVDQVRTKDGLVVVGTHGNGLYSAKFEISQPGVIVINLIEEVLAKVNNQDIDIDLSSVFQSTKSPSLPLTFSADTDNPTLLTPTVNGNVLTLTFIEDEEGEATVNVAAQDTEMASAFTSFKVTVEFVNDKFPYVKSFESGPNEWVAGGISSSWELGEPNNTLIDQASKGTQAWVTDLDGSYSSNEQSFVESPKFDLSSLNKPKFVMDIWWETEDGFDGAALQSSTDGGQTWSTVGSIADNPNWYTGTADALGFSGSTKGWEGRNENGSGGWIRAKHSLKSLKGETRVKFRIVFGSDFLVQDEGFAFDNVQVLDDLTSPSDLTNNPTANSIKLKWLDNSNNETGFEIERSKDNDLNFKLITTADKDKTSFNDKNVNNEFVYFYRLASVNNQGTSEFSNVVNTGLIPLSPSGLVIDASPGDVILGWLDNSNNENEFVVERSLTDNQNFEEIGRVGEDIITITDEDLDGVTEFVYRVAAANDWGQSDFSDEVSVITVGFKDELFEELQIYPNPTNGKIKIVWGKSQWVNGQILIRDVSGRVVVNAERLVQNQIMDLDMSQLQSGVYIVEFIANNRILTFRKILKQ
ncbi:MAG: T9SS type A sorting domain-containing protein, partial [Bacteroidetes bacterium]|nr:T9SS type A sorting domain-containing protein [Bacteroidota bacterium]